MLSVLVLALGMATGILTGSAGIGCAGAVGSDQNLALSGSVGAQTGGSVGISGGGENASNPTGVDTATLGSEDAGSGPGDDLRFDLSLPDLGEDDGDDPRTCAQAKSRRTYVGCEFWPTVTFNPVLENFDFAVAVANASEEAAQLEIWRGDSFVTRTEVPAAGLEAVRLPWIPELKGPQFDAKTMGARPKSSVRVDGGAYRLVSSVPVTAWQFNPLQYSDAPENCALVQDIDFAEACLSVSNDASLLIPQPAMRGSYRVMLKDSVKGTEGGFDDTPGSVAITATRDATTVEVRLAAGVEIAPGPGVAAIAAGGQAEYRLDAGDVLQIMGKSGAWWGEPHHDLSGSLIQSDAPVQVVATVALTSVPSPEVAGDGYADHLEELVLPTEVLGKDYLVVPPTSSQGQNIGHYVRLYGNFDGTTIDYPGHRPAGAPTHLGAGQVVTLSADAAFRLVASHALGVAVFGKGGQRHTPNAVPTSGDPMFSVVVATEQFRSRYIFLAPVDYLHSFADIVMPQWAEPTLDGQPLTGRREPIEGTEWVIVREPLEGRGVSGAHRLEATQLGPDGRLASFGLQVMGYGHATGYMYPGGLNLELISIPPAR